MAFGMRCRSYVKAEVLIAVLGWAYRPHFMWVVLGRTGTADLRQRYIMHADDIGLSPGITRSILGSIDEGHVRSVSLIVNGWGLDEAVEGLKAGPNVRISLHLNLLEGVPLCGADCVPLLIGADGRLNATFQRLFWLWARGGQAGRDELVRQIGLEFAAQVALGLRVLGDRLGRLRIDSHTHIHALPFVMDAILSMGGASKIEAVRLPREPWHVSSVRADRSWMFGANIVKHLLLNRLSATMATQLAARGISHNPMMLGVLHTGGMTRSAIEAGVAACEKRALGRSMEASTDNDCEPVEVLLHPGRADPSEIEFWKGRPDLWAYYSSEAREKELLTAQDVELRKIFMTG